MYGIWQYSSKGSVDGISGNVDMDYGYIDYPSIIKSKGFNGYAKENTPAPVASSQRDSVVAQARAWLGKKEADGSHKVIIDTYNSHKPLARGYAMKYTDAWCATFVSAVAIKCGVTDILPTECSCDEMIALQREMAKRGKGRKYHSGVHSFSSKVRCGECGSWYGSKVWHSTDKYRRVAPSPSRLVGAAGILSPAAVPVPTPSDADTTAGTACRAAQSLGLEMLRGCLGGGVSPPLSVPSLGAIA